MLDCTAFVNKSFEPHIKMEATFTILAISEMLLYDFNFVNTEFPINIKMKTSCCLKTIHSHFLEFLALTKHHLRMPPNSFAGRKQVFLVGEGQR